MAHRAYERERRWTSVAIGLAGGLGMLALAAALLLRLQPGSSRLFPADDTTHPGSPVRSAGTAGRDSVTAAAPRLTTATAAAQTPQPEAVHLARPADGTVKRGRRGALMTDVVLLPCSLENPGPDGSYTIPPHNPRHRTIVGLPYRPGGPKQGLVLPPHDPARENEIPIVVIEMDSILTQWLRVPPHDPERFNTVRRDTVPCVQADSS